MNKATTLKLVAPKQPHALAGKPVLESAPLRRGHKRSALSCFEDGTWTRRGLRSKSALPWRRSPVSSR